MGSVRRGRRWQREGVRVGGRPLARLPHALLVPLLAHDVPGRLVPQLRHEDLHQGLLGALRVPGRGPRRAVGQRSRAAGQGAARGPHQLEGAAAP